MEDKNPMLDIEADPKVEERIRTENEERIARCAPIAQKVLDLLNANKSSIVFGENEKVKGSVKGTAEQVIELFLKEDIHWSDRQFIFQLAFQPLVHLSETVETSFGISWDRALAHKWGKDSLDLKISDVHNALVDSVKSKEAK